MRAAGAMAAAWATWRAWRDRDRVRRAGPPVIWIPASAITTTRIQARPITEATRRRAGRPT